MEIVGKHPLDPLDIFAGCEDRLRENFSNHIEFGLAEIVTIERDRLGISDHKISLRSKVQSYLGAAPQIPATRMCSNNIFPRAEPLFGRYIISIFEPNVPASGDAGLPYSDPIRPRDFFISLF